MGNISILNVLILDQRDEENGEHPCETNPRNTAKSL